MPGWRNGRRSRLKICFPLGVRVRSPFRVPFDFACNGLIFQAFFVWTRPRGAEISPLYIPMDQDTADHSSDTPLSCRERCGACCIAPSISSPIPGMPDGKPAGIPCVQLDENMRCRLFSKPERPKVCSSLAPEREMCGKCREEALAYLTLLEQQTTP